MAEPVANDYAAIAVRMREIEDDEYLSAFARRMLQQLNDREAAMQRADEPADDRSAQWRSG